MSSPKKYPIPDYPPSIGLEFTKLCKSAVTDDASLIGNKINLFRMKLTMWENPKSPVSPHDVKLATMLLERANFMLSNFSKYSDSQKRLVSAAINYLNLQRDGINDETPVVGLQDDVKIFNHVLEELGVTNKFIII